MSLLWWSFFSLCSLSCSVDVPALFRAAEKGHEAEVERLVESGANINEINMSGTDGMSTFGHSALSYASWQGNWRMVSILLRLRADPDLRAFNLTPLVHACKRGRFDVVKVLIAAGANPNLDNFSNSPFYWSAFFDHVDIAFHLLINGANVDLEKMSAEYCDRNHEPGLKVTYKKILELKAIHDEHVNFSNLADYVAPLPNSSVLNIDIVEQSLRDHHLGGKRRHG